HDNQRSSNIYFGDGVLYDLANVFMLAHPYGYPAIMSSFNFDRSSKAGQDQGPPSEPNGNTYYVYYKQTTTHDCTAEHWRCEHRHTYIANMVGFRKATKAVSTVTDIQTIGPNQVAFGRGNAGFVIINRENYPLSTTVQTSMAPGTYCNVLA